MVTIQYSISEAITRKSRRRKMMRERVGREKERGGEGKGGMGRYMFIGRGRDKEDRGREIYGRERGV